MVCAPFYVYILHGFCFVSSSRSGDDFSSYWRSLQEFDFLKNYYFCNLFCLSIIYEQLEKGSFDSLRCMAIKLYHSGWSLEMYVFLDKFFHCLIKDSDIWVAGILERIKETIPTYSWIRVNVFSWWYKIRYVSSFRNLNFVPFFMNGSVFFLHWQVLLSLYILLWILYCRIM